MSTMRFAVFGALLFLQLFYPGAASSHPEFALSTVNRYGKLVLSSLSGGGTSGSRIFYTLMVGGVPAYTLRQKADRDGNGQLDEAEQQALADRLAETVKADARLSLMLDGQPLSVVWEAPLLQLSDRRVAPLSFACELSARLPIDGGATSEAEFASVHLLRYEDRVRLDPVGDVELRIEEGPGIQIETAWQGHRPPSASPIATAMPQPGRDPSWVFVNQGPPQSLLSDRSISIRFKRKANQQAGLKTPMRMGGLTAFAITLVMAMGLLFFHKLARRRQPNKPAAK